MEKKIFILAGEASGDLHGSMLVKYIRRISNGFAFQGVGGPLLRREGVDTLYDCSQFSSMGIVEPLLKIWFYRKARERIRSCIVDGGFDAVVLIDFPGFNLSLAKRLEGCSVKVIYYISPQIWAWHYSRIKKIKRYIHHMIVLYPFEEEMYRGEGVRAYFKGNPLVDIVREKLEEGSIIRHEVNPPCIVMLPGSRMDEARRHVNTMLEAALLLFKKYGSTVLFPVLSGSSGDFVKDRINDFLLEHKVDIKVIFDNTQRAMDMADFIVTSSGTATLEAALLGKPMVIIYKIGIIFELAARLLMRVKNISLVNIVAGEEICTELLQREATGKRIFMETVRVLDNTETYNKMKRRILGLKEKLGEPGAAARIAELCVSLIREDTAT